MSETVVEVVEQVELEASAEEAFEYLADPEIFCAFVRIAEESRRVDLSKSRWLLRGPEDRSVEYEPETFQRCLRSYRNRLVHGVGSSPRGSEGAHGQTDVVLDRGVIELKRLSREKTLVLLTTHLLDLARSSEDWGEGESSSVAGPAGAPGQATRYGRAFLDLHVVVTHLFPYSQYGEGGVAGSTLENNLALEVRHRSPSSFTGPEDTLTDEDRAWLENDLSDLQEYGAYEWAEGELESYSPVTFVPGVGLVAEEDDPQEGKAGDTDGGY